MKPIIEYARMLPSRESVLAISLADLTLFWNYYSDL